MPQERAPNGWAADAEPLGQGLLGGTILVERDDLGLGTSYGVPARGNLAPPQFPLDDTRAYPGFGSRDPAGFARKVGRDGSLHDHRVGSVRPRRFDPGSFGTSSDGFDVYARLGMDLLKRLAGRVETDRIIDLRRTAFSGHVYNLQTSEGWYEASGLIVSNCRCTAAAVWTESALGTLAQNQVLQQQWREVTKGYSGRNAINAWRRWWNAQHPDAVGTPRAA
jgi:hypothetical protein